MERLPNGYHLHIPQGAFPLSTDSMVLAHFVRLGRNARVLDLGSGCGTLGLLLCARAPLCSVTGLELDPAAHAAALENIRQNGLSGRMVSLPVDLRRADGYIPAGSMDAAVSNPPYFSGGPESLRHKTARREDLCSPEALLGAAARALKYGGDLFLVHRPERLAQLIAIAATLGLEAKRLCLLRHREGQPVNLVLLAFRKGGKPGLNLEEACLFDAQGGADPLLPGSIPHMKPWRRSKNGRNALSCTHTHRKSGGYLYPLPPGAGGGGFHRRRGYPGEPEAFESSGHQKKPCQLL